MKRNINISNYSVARHTVMLFGFALLLFSIGLAAPLQAQVTQLSASVDRNTVLLDESIQFTLSAAGSTTRDAIDFSALQTNFRMSQPSFSQSTQIINGTMSRTVSWILNLYPKQTGEFTIPSFSIDGQQSNEFVVRILPVDTAASDQPREFYVTSNIDNQAIYLQQQILYTVKIHLSRDIQRGQLTQPNLEGAIVEQIGEDQDYQEIIDGVRYRIIERKYAIIPQASGDFTISGPMFEAEVSTNSRRSFANFGRSTTIARRAPDIDINVRPIPDNYNNTWLPSEMVEISEQWQGNTEPFTVGEPVTRTITLTALGLTKEQLPTINLPYHPSFKVYPEQANLATVERNNKLIAQGVFNSAIIPEEAGDFIMPEARIPWFNVNTGETEFAILPAKSIKVVMKPNTGQPSPQLPVSQAVNENTSRQLDGEPTLVMHASGLNWLHYVLISTNVFTLIALYVFWIMTRRASEKPQKAQQNTVSPSANEEEAFMHLTNLLKESKLEGFNEALEGWLKALFAEDYYSISTSLATHPESKALDAYNTILGNRFSAKHQEISYNELIDRFSDFRQCAKVENKQAPLSKLYPK
jgi:hypothetical protein